MKDRNGLRILTGALFFIDPPDYSGLIDRTPLPEIAERFKLASDRHYPTHVLYRLQEGRCFYCGQPMINAHHQEDNHGFVKAHLYPRNLGWALWGNKVLTHTSCGKKWRREMPTELHVAKFKRLYSDAVFEAAYDREKGEM